MHHLKPEGLAWRGPPSVWEAKGLGCPDSRANSSSYNCVMHVPDLTSGVELMPVSIYIRGMRGLNEIMHTNRLAQSLAYCKCSVNVPYYYDRRKIMRDLCSRSQRKRTTALLYRPLALGRTESTPPSNLAAAVYLRTSIQL